MQQELQQESEKLRLLETRLSDLEKGKLFAFCQDKAMVHAVEKVMLYAMYQTGTVQKDDKDMKDVDTNWVYGVPYNTNTTNEMYGASVRAKVEGLSILEDAFKQIKKFGVETVIPEIEKNVAI